MTLPNPLCEGGIGWVFCYLLSAVLLLLGVTHGLYYVEAVGEGTGELTVLLLCLGEELHTEARHILVSVKLVLGNGALGAEVDKESAKTVKLHLVRVLKLIVHGLYHLHEHRHHITLLHRAVLLNALGYLVKVYSGGMHRAAIPKLSSISTIVLISYILNCCHNFF